MVTSYVFSDWKWKVLYDISKGRELDLMSRSVTVALPSFRLCSLINDDNTITKDGLSWLDHMPIPKHIVDSEGVLGPKGCCPELWYDD